MSVPLITKDTVNSVIHELMELGGSEYFAELLDRMRRDNYEAAEFLSLLALNHEDPLAVSAAGLLIYRLLESQYEANQMNAAFGAPEAGPEEVSDAE